MTRSNDELPKGWADARLDELGQLQLGKMLDSAKNSGNAVSYLRNINVRWFRFDLSDLKEVRVSDEERERLSVRDGDLFICEGGEPGRCAVWREGANQLVYQKALHRFRTNGAIVPEVLMHRLRLDAEVGALYETFTGTTIKHLTRETLLKYEVPLPPLAEQKRIADKLEAVLGRVDACRARLDHVPDLLKRFRQSVLAAATSGQLTEDWRETVKAESLRIAGGKNSASNGLPDGWRAVELASVVENHDNRRIPVKSSDRKRRGGTFPYYGAFGIIDSIDAFLFDGEFVLLAEDGKNLESRDRPIALIATGKFWVNNHAHVLQPKKDLDIGYLGYSLNSPTLEIDSLLTGIDQIKLTRGAMDRIELNLPPLPEQQEIVRRVEALFAFADRIEARLAKARAQVERLTPATLAKAFRGELVPQDPNDEPASALLERLRNPPASTGLPIKSRKANRTKPTRVTDPAPPAQFT